jgi:hypothetical protein
MDIEDKNDKIMEDEELVNVLNPIDYYTKKDLCKGCKFDETFLCDSKYAEGLVENYFKQYNIKIYVYQFDTKDKIKIINRIHSKELEHHRNGEYFALQSTNFHCGDACDCEGSKFRCWNFDQVSARSQPHCIKFFGLDLPDKYKKDNVAFILGNHCYKSKSMVRFITLDDSIDKTIKGKEV